jgi:hypothetical protein
VPTNWTDQVSNAISNLETNTDRVLEPARALAILDDVVEGKLAAYELATPGRRRAACRDRTAHTFLPCWGFARSAASLQWREDGALVRSDDGGKLLTLWRGFSADRPARVREPSWSRAWRAAFCQGRSLALRPAGRTPRPNRQDREWEGMPWRRSGSITLGWQETTVGVPRSGR